MSARMLVHKGVFTISKLPLVRYGLTKLYDLAHRKDPFMLRHPVDVEYQIETSGCRPGSLLHSGDGADRHVTGYAGSQPSTVLRVVNEIEQPREYIFIDIGCGKGRVLAIASKLGFRRVIGIEMSPELCRVAVENSENWPGPTLIGQGSR